MPIFQKIISNGDTSPCLAAPFAVKFLQKIRFFAYRFSGVGGASPLDLINGHLTDNGFIPVSRGLPPHLEPKNWFCRQGHNPNKDFHYVAKLQAFESGGYEVTFLKTDLKRLADCMDAPRCSGKRVQGEQDENNVISSVNRSKRRIRHLIKSMGCDRMLTLTRRESDPTAFWTVKDWVFAWDRFNRLCKRMGVSLVYVAVLECHKKGNYHLHAAIAGRINVNHIRKIWLACCGGGKGSGNVDVAMKQGLTDYKRRAGLAKYVSKYVAKQLGQTEFNKKRYWSSRHKLPPVRRYILSADDLQAALFEFANSFLLNSLHLFPAVFMFKLGSCAWFSFDDCMLAPPPF